MIAEEYIPPDASVYRKGWKLCVVKEGFAPPLSCHKTLNYLYFLQTRQAAIDAGADEAVVLDPQGNVSEAAAGSLLIRIHGQWRIPRSSFQLSGITVRHVSRMLREAGSLVESRVTPFKEIYSAKTVWLLNSLMGIMPVYAIDGLSLPEPRADEAAELREKLFSMGR